MVLTIIMRVPTRLHNNKSIIFVHANATASVVVAAMILMFALSPAGILNVSTMVTTIIVRVPTQLRNYNSTRIASADVGVNVVITTMKLMFAMGPINIFKDNTMDVTRPCTGAALTIEYAMLTLSFAALIQRTFSLCLSLFLL